MPRRFLRKLLCLAVAALTALTSLTAFADNKGDILNSLGVSVNDKESDDLVTRAEFAQSSCGPRLAAA